MNKKKRRLWWLLAAVPLLIAAIVAMSAFVAFADDIAAIKSIKELESGLYYMEYRGEYGFDSFIEAGGAATDGEMAQYITEYITKGMYGGGNTEALNEPYACSTVSGGTGGRYFFGRNFDWHDCTAMIVRTVPENGYASISTVNLEFLGFGEGYTPQGSVMEKFMALSAVYVPLDGMNEKGLCVADLVVGDGELGETHQVTDRPDLTTVSAIRLLLDHAATVDEAIALLEGFDMNSSAQMMHHLSISDAAGAAVVIEYIDDVMYVTDTPAVTNFFLAPGEAYGLGGDSAMAKERYEMLIDIYQRSDAGLSGADVKQALMDVSSGTLKRGLTQWSIVYDKTDLTMELWFHEQYQSGYRMSIVDGNR